MTFAADFVIVGHRGAAGLAPENTLVGFRLAEHLGVHAIECDLQLVDGHLAVFHDAVLERTTNGVGRLADMSWQALRQLDAGGGERVPELDEVLAALAPSTGLNIELKGRGTGSACARHPALHLAERNVLVSSFHVCELEAFRHGMSEHSDCPESVSLGLIRRQCDRHMLTESARLGIWSIHIQDAMATPAGTREIMAAGFQVMVFTVNCPARMKELRDMGARGIFTDHPERMCLNLTG